MFDLNPLLIAELLLLGSCTGFLAGLFGIGGGMLMVPFMTIIFTVKHFPPDLIIKMAVATSLATICFTSISSVRAHHQRGAVHWGLSARLAPGILLGSWLGAWLAASMSSRLLALLFGLLNLVSAVQMWQSSRRPTSQTPGEAEAPLPSSGELVAAGGGIGVLSGMLGAGGAFISVPYMTWRKVRMHTAVATAASLGFPIALAGSASYVFHGWGIATLPSGALGYVFVPALLVISAASVLTAPLGARTAHRLPTAELKRYFVWMLAALAAYMLYRAAAG
jgi:uncharacterized membrane protein YfcA